MLARAGIFIRELNTWAIHIFFDGTDIHTGIGATTTLSVSDFKSWVDTELETAWKVSELGRMGIVQYAMRSAHNRDTYMSMMPAGRFGNIVPKPAVHVRDYANHAEGILGGREAWANRMGREIVFNFWNQLQVCNLDLGKDIGDILQSVMFKDYDGQPVALQPLPFHPIKDAAFIALKRAHFEYLRQRSSRLRIFISKAHFLQFRESLRRVDYDPTKDREALYVEWQARTSISARSVSGMEAAPRADFRGKVVKILEPVRLDGQVSNAVVEMNSPIHEYQSQIWYHVSIDDDDDDPERPTYFVAQNDPRSVADSLDQSRTKPIPGYRRTCSTNSWPRNCRKFHFLRSWTSKSGVYVHPQTLCRCRIRACPRPIRLVVHRRLIDLSVLL